jgi:hypothetical protein
VSVIGLLAVDAIHKNKGLNFIIIIFIIKRCCEVIQLKQIIKFNLSVFPHLSHVRLFGPKTFSKALGTVLAVPN